MCTLILAHQSNKSYARCTPMSAWRTLVWFQSKGTVQAEQALSSCDHEHSAGLDLEATRAATATSLLELAASGAHEWAGLGAWAAGHTEVSHGSAGSAATAQQHSVGASGSHHSQLIQSVHLATSGQDALASTLGHLQGGQLQGWDVVAIQTHVISHSAYYYSDLVGLAGPV